MEYILILWRECSGGSLVSTYITQPVTGIQGTEAEITTKALSFTPPSGASVPKGSLVST